MRRNATACEEELEPVDKLEILRHGLGQTDSPKEVLILGAGMAGLMAGKLLKEAGHEVTIIEGNTRVGGRVHTLREPFTGDRYVDVGAMRIPTNHLLTLTLIRQMGVETRPFINAMDNNIMKIYNQMTTRGEYDENPDIFPFPVAPHEEGKTAKELLESVVNPFLERYLQSSEEERKQMIRDFDEYSLYRFLTENPIGPSLSPGALHKVQVVFGFDGTTGLSFLDFFFNLINQIFIYEGDFVEITGGNDHLPKSFLPLLEEDIYLDQRVERIVQRPDGVEVETRSPITGEFSQFSGDVVITTIPFSIFQFVEMEPYESVSYEKRKAIQTLHYVPAFKMMLEFSRPFWVDDGIMGGSSVLDTPPVYMFYPSHLDNQESPAVIQATYTWGDHARYWEALSEEEQIRAALKVAASLHGDHIWDEYIGGAGYSWDANPFAGGCFAMYIPGQAATYPSIIQAPEGRIHFAGEHTSMFHAWIEGAVDSGIRTAWEIQCLAEKGEGS
ncbi:flavin monoamine oxidase family protein [Salsuginibacillus kocurii]|uniref:flavin monoamine oxidase family protein n=1 Tax=Salsuginibacillus kocurii TaxID=427078 RepID=UPI00037F2FED|nr:flavin monoamine oxidase family protein [Salsuginibacillus kocurii]